MAALQPARACDPPDAWTPQLARAGMARARGGFGEAVEIHEDLLAAGAGRLSRLELARDFRSAGLIDRALAQLVAILDSYPDDGAALAELEGIHVQLRDWPAAIEVRQRMERSPASSRVLAQMWAALGRHALAAGDADSARFAFETSIRISPQVADGYVGLGDVMQTHGRGEAASRLWTRALGLRPDTGALVYPRLSRTLDPERREILLREQAARGDRLAALWSMQSALDALAPHLEGDSMAIWAALQQLPGELPLAAELAGLCAGAAGSRLADVIRERIRTEIEAARISCAACGARASRPQWLCPICLHWEEDETRPTA